MWITLLILLGALVLFLTEWLRVDVVALIAVISLMLTQVLTPSEALAGFSSSLVLLIASLFVVGGAVLRTGLASMLSDRILQLAGTNETRLMIVIMLTVAVMSAFISNTGTVAVLLPAVLTLAVSTHIRPSKLLIPLAFSSSLGGAMTLIGTPPNLVVSQELEKAGYPAFGFFDFMPIGLVLVVIGIAFMLLTRKHTLPDHCIEDDYNIEHIDEELLETYHLPQSIYRLRVRSVSPIIGKQLQDIDFTDRYNINVLEIMRPHPPQKLATLGEQEILIQRRSSPLHPHGHVELQRDDVLIVRSEESSINDVSRRYNLAIQPRKSEDQETLISQEVGIAEVVIPPESAYVGKTVKDMRIGSNLELTVLHIRRSGAEETLNVAHTPLQFGDVLLVKGRYEKIAQLENVHDLVLISPEAIQARVFNRRKAPITLLVLVGMLLLLITQVIEPVVATMLASIMIVLTGCLSIDDAYDLIDWKSIILIGGMIPLSTALIKVGLIDIMATGVTEVLGAAGPTAVMVGLFAITAVLTQVLSNTATSVLLAPLAIAIAESVGVSPQAFVMSIAVAASMAFATPMASPVNTLVMSAGHYSFADYAKAGIPLIIITFVVTVMLLPLLFPF